MAHLPVEATPTAAKNGARSHALTTPTRSYVESTPGERLVGFVMASVFSGVYVVAPVYAFAVLVALWRAPTSMTTLLFCVPMAISVALPETWLPAIGERLLRTAAMRQIPKYFRYEEFAETTDADVLALHARGERVIACVHPHGVFPFVSVCAAVATVGETDGLGKGLWDIPTAAASVIRFLPVLKDVIGIFGMIDASGKVLAARLRRRRGSAVLYVGGMVEIFKSDDATEAVFLRERKGFIKVALREGADVIPIYSFGNSTALNVLKWGPLVSLSRRLGVSVTLFWGRWGLPVPKRVKLVYARGRPLGLPHIPNPTPADVDAYHALYCEKLVHLFDTYKKHHPDFAHKTLVVE